MKDLQGKVALITGAASGIGRGMVEVFGEAGLKIVAADINANRLEETEATMKAAGIAGFTSVLDVRDRPAWEALLDRAWADLGPVQVVCNNAGVTATPQPFLDTPAEAWDWVNGINMTGAFHGSQAVARRLLAQGLPGHIVNTASVQGLYAGRNFVAYNASKFGVVGLTETLAIELTPLGIGVSVLCPGPVRGDLLRNSAAIAPHLVATGQGRAREGFEDIFMQPAKVGEIVLAGIEADRFYIFTHDEYAPIIAAREAALSASLGKGDPDLAARIGEIEADVLATYQAIRAQAS